jgi:hypothetical protein
MIRGGLGLYTGALVYGLMYDRIVPALSSWGRAGAVTFATLLHVEPWLVIVLFSELVTITFYLIERGSTVAALASKGARKRSRRPERALRPRLDSR